MCSDVFDETFEHVDPRPVSDYQWMHGQNQYSFLLIGRSKLVFPNFQNFSGGSLIVKTSPPIEAEIGVIIQKPFDRQLDQTKNIYENKCDPNLLSAVGTK